MIFVVLPGSMAEFNQTTCSSITLIPIQIHEPLTQRISMHSETENIRALWLTPAHNKISYTYMSW